MCGLELLELAQEVVELGVGDLGLVEQVVALGVVLEQRSKLDRACRDVGRRHVAGGPVVLVVVVVGGCVGGSVGGLVGGAFVAGDVGATSVDAGSVGVVGVSFPLSSNAKITSSNTATAMMAQITITAARCQPDHPPSKSSPRPGGRAPPPPPPEGPVVYACVGSPESWGYATGFEPPAFETVGSPGDPGAGWGGGYVIESRVYEPSGTRARD